MAVTHHRIAAGVSLQAGAADPASHRGRKRSEQYREADLVVGVDTHLDTHTAAICDARGRVMSQLQVRHGRGIRAAAAWAGSRGGEAAVTWAIEGTRHYGLGLARHLTADGQQVAEIDASRTRASGARQERCDRRRPRRP